MKNLPLAALLLSACTSQSLPGELEPTLERVEKTRADLQAVHGVDISHWSGEITDAEVACWYETGVRHVVAGTQMERITRQQLELAIAGGMSIDLYVYLYWEDPVRQVERALRIARDYPIGRLWLDVEEDPAGLGPAALTTRIRDALAACGEVPCGIYTSKWWWDPFMWGRATFNDVPLWYARYDDDPSLDTWATQSFGGWDRPAGKQWIEHDLCGIDVDENTIEALGPRLDGPGVLGTRADAPPLGLSPDGEHVWREHLRLVASTVEGAERYAFEIETWNGAAWRHYWTYEPRENARRFNPGIDDVVYRWRVRAQVEGVWGPWSRHAHFDYGTPRNRPPEEAADEVPDEVPPEPEREVPPEPEREVPPEPAEPEVADEPVVEEAEPEPEPPPEAAPEDPPGAPTPLAPEADAHIVADSVTLECAPVEGASRYAFEVENFVEGRAAWVAYHTWSDPGPQRRFWPVVSAQYRWRVHATTADGPSEASAWRHFEFEKP